MFIQNPDGRIIMRRPTQPTENLDVFIMIDLTNKGRIIIRQHEIGVCAECGGECSAYDGLCECCIHINVNDINLAN